MQHAPRTTRFAVAAVAVMLALVLGGTAAAASAIEAPPPATPDELYANQLYTDFFGRRPTANETQNLVSALHADQITRDEAGVGAAASYAYAKQLVDGFYLNTLGRGADGAGEAYWTDQIWAGHRSVAQVAAEIYASNEWYSSVGGTNAAWVTALYQRLLGRAPEPGGSAYWQQRTQTEGRVIVAIIFYQTDESLRARTAALYAHLLGRSPDDAGLTFWASQVLARGDRVVAGLLAGSDEYYARAQQGGSPPATTSASTGTFAPQ